MSSPLPQQQPPQQPESQQPRAIPARIFLAFSMAISSKSVSKLLLECANWSNQGTEEIHLFIASPGGNILAGIYAYNVLRALPVKIVTYNAGNVDSVANIIFLAGDERIALPHATFMFHGVVLDFSGNIHANMPWLTDRLDSINADHRKMASIIQERASFTNIEEILDLFSSQATRDADYALSKGLIHKIERAKVPDGNRLLVCSE